MFAALFNADRSPVDLALLGTAGRDARILGTHGHVVLLRSEEASAAHNAETSAIQSLGGRLWIVGRIRLDARGDLEARLGQPASDDALLCLHAYVKWGDDFLDRLAGDFCFVLWDEAEGCLIVARDQLGIRSLFHARAGETWLFSDALDWVASRQGNDDELDDYWIVDFLSFEHSLDFDRTIYRHIHRLAPAHVMTVSGAETSVRRYWRLAIGDPLYFPDHRHYGERFRELTRQAVADRMPSGRVGITMSGGLDSTTLAACAVDVAGTASRVMARCSHYETLIPDDEATYATLAARHLGVDLQLAALDDALYDPRWRRASITGAEPWAGIVHARADRAEAEAMAAVAAVWFEGEGPDNALRFERNAYFGWLASRRQWRRLAETAWLYAKAKGLSGWRDTVRRYVGPGGPILPEVALPGWLNRDLVGRLHLVERLNDSEKGTEPAHPWHPRAMASFEDPIWQSVLADCDRDEAQASFVWRHPFLDLRVLEFMLSVPPVPWARRKLIMREAMRGKLPAPILSREKTPLTSDPWAETMRGCRLPELGASDRVGRWVDVGRLADAEAAGGDIRRILPAHALDYWLTAR